MPHQAEMQTDQFRGSNSRCIRPHRCAVCDVRSLSICGALDQTDLLELERIGRCVHLAPNAALFTAGQPAGAVYNLTAGVARLYKLLPDGRRQILGFGLPGDFVGAGPSNHYSCSGEAIEAVSACRVSADLFARFQRAPYSRCEPGGGFGSSVAKFGRGIRIRRAASQKRLIQVKDH